MRFAMWCVLAVGLCAGCGKKSGPPPLPPSVKVSGKVVAGGGKSTANLMMVVAPLDEAIKTAPLISQPLKDTGEFAFQSPPGKYRVSFAPIPRQGGSMDGGLPAADASKESVAWRQVQMEMTVPEGGGTGIELKVP